MRVDQPRHDDVTLEVEHFIGSGREIPRRSGLGDDPVFDKKTTIRKFGLVVIHRDDMSVFDEEGSHVVWLVWWLDSRLVD